MFLAYPQENAPGIWHEILTVHMWSEYYRTVGLWSEMQHLLNMRMTWQHTGWCDQTGIHWGCCQRHNRHLSMWIWLKPVLCCCPCSPRSTQVTDRARSNSHPKKKKNRLICQFFMYFDRGNVIDLTFEQSSALDLNQQPLDDPNYQV